MSPRTTVLKLQLMLYKMRVVSVGSQSEFHREFKQLTGAEACVFAAKLEFNVIILLVPCWFGVL